MTAQRLPLFPLPLVLFPGAPLPLHIFEPRYRRMLADCLAGDRRFGLVCLQRGAAETSLPAGEVGCVAVIEQTEPLADGRSNILVRGAERFAFQRYEDGALPYHLGVVHPFEDDPEPAGLLEPLAAQVRELFLTAARAARTLADNRDALPELPDEPARLSFAVAAAVDFPLDERQALLSSRSPKARLERLADMLARALVTLGARAEVHERAKSNGRGPHAVS